jgi:putative transposase
LGTAKARDVFLSIFEQVRRKYRFKVIGFLVMPEHVHLLVSEPEKANPSVVMQVLRQRVSQRWLRNRRRRNRDQMELWVKSEVKQRFWQRRSYDFNVFSERKMTEKLRCMHRNPIKRGLVSWPELWRWSSYRAYAFGERGPVNMDWMFPPYVVTKTKPRRFGEPDENEPKLGEAHPSNIAKGAAPTSRYNRPKSKP